MSQRYVRVLEAFTLSGTDYWKVVPYNKWNPRHWFKTKFILPTPGAHTTKVNP